MVLYSQFLISEGLGMTVEQKAVSISIAWFIINYNHTIEQLSSLHKKRISYQVFLAKIWSIPPSDTRPQFVIRTCPLPGICPQNFFTI